jgi:hypothetical protein
VRLEAFFLLLSGAGFRVHVRLCFRVRVRERTATG